MKEKEAQFRAVMGRHVSGVSVIACRLGHEVVAMTVGSVTSVSLKPLLLLACIREQSRLLPALLQARTFSVNLLSGEQTDVSRFYGGQSDGQCPAQWLSDDGEVPVLEGANASLICELHSATEAGDHSIIVGGVRDMLVFPEPGSSLAYVGGRYRSVQLQP